MISVMPVGDVAVSLVTDKDHIVLAGAKFEPKTRAIWAKWCKGGGTVIDVGAYNGLFSIAAALYGCRAFGLEPMPFNYRRSLANAKLNKVSVDLRNVAASDRQGSGNLVFNPAAEFSVSGSLVRTKGSRVRVDTVTIDDHIGPLLTTLNAIKIDVERAEPLVLRGAIRTLAHFRPKLIVEALGARERDLVMASLSGYALADMVDGRNMVLLPI